jgi:predicted DNA-binding transcriptional regulator AlpA
MTDEAKFIYDELKAEGYPLLIDKRQYAKILNISTSSIDNYIRDGHSIPNYKKLGKAKNAKIVFSLGDVAQYLANQTIKTA